MSKASARQENSKPEKRRKPPKRVTQSWLHNAGLHYLERFAASSAHFERVMLRKIDRSCAFHADQDRKACVLMLQELLQKFQRSGLLDDRAFAAGAVSSLRRRGMSARAIEHRLISRGLGAAQIRTALQSHDDGTGADADYEAALRLARRKKIGPFARAPQDESALKKSMAIMARAGFSYETCRRILNAPVDFSEADAC